MKMPAKPASGYPERMKSRLIKESLEPGANVSAIARREKVPPSMLFGWRRKLATAKKASLAAQPVAIDKPRFARVEIPRNVRSGMIEVVVGQVVLRAGSDVDAEHFAKLIRGVLP